VTRAVPRPRVSQCKQRLRQPGPSGAVGSIEGGRQGEALPVWTGPSSSRAFSCETVRFASVLMCDRAFRGSLEAEQVLVRLRLLAETSRNEIGVEGR